MIKDSFLPLWPKRSHLNREKGATLFTAVIFLIMLAMLGVNAAQMSSLEERMAGNTRNRDLAFQAAESALKHVEKNLGSGQKIREKYTHPLPADGSEDGDQVEAGIRYIDRCYPNSASYWNGSGDKDCGGTSRSYAWSVTGGGATARQPSQTLNQISEQPMYVVERMPDVGATERYRVTARGTGGTTDAVVILQAIYSYTP